MKTKGNLRDLLDILNEDVPVPQPKNMQDFSPPNTPLNVSLDQAVDRYIVRYEKESIPTSDTYGGYIEEPTGAEQNPVESLLEKFLNEAEGLDLGGEEEPPAEDPAAGGPPVDAEPGVSPSVDDNGQPTTDKSLMSTPQINLQDFTRNIARLINNYEALLNPKEILINRVKEYISTNYDQRTAREFEELLSKNYNLTTLKNTQGQADQWPTSYAVGALGSD